MREQERGAAWFLYRAVVWVDAYRVRVFSVLTVAAAVAYWLTGWGLLQLLAIASLTMVFANMLLEGLRRWKRGRPGS